MEAPRDTGAVIDALEAASGDIRAFLPDLPRLIRDEAMHHGLAAAVAYAFLRLEVGHRRALHVGLVRIHGIPATLAAQATQREHLSREHFHRLLKAILGAPLPAEARRDYDVASGVRDDLLHGKEVSPASLRKALLALVQYAIALERFCLDGGAGGSPFAEFSDAGETPGRPVLANDTARFVLRGMGFLAFD